MILNKNNFVEFLPVKARNFVTNWATDSLSKKAVRRECT